MGEKEVSWSTDPLKKKKNHGWSLKHFVSCCFSALSWPGNILSVAFSAENRCLLFSHLVRSQLVVKQGHHKIVSVHVKAKNTFLTWSLCQQQITCKRMGWGVYTCSQGNQDASLPAKLGLSDEENGWESIEDWSVTPTIGITQNTMNTRGQFLLHSYITSWSDA